MASVGGVAGWFYYLAAVEDAVKIQMGDWQDGLVDEGTAANLMTWAPFLWQMWWKERNDSQELTFWHLCRCHVECTPTRIHKQTNQ